MLHFMISGCLMVIHILKFSIQSEWWLWRKDGSKIIAEYKRFNRNTSSVGRWLCSVQLWLWDRDVSEYLAVESALNVNSDVRQLFKYMEWAVHGIPWLTVSSVTFTVLMRRNADMEVTYKFAILLFGLCIDLASVGLIKVFVRRQRPIYNKDDQVYEAPVADKFSFPSGHSSRSAMLTVLGLSFCSPPSWIAVIIGVFPFILGLSRVAMGRHYISDVLVGLLLGWMEGHFAQQLPYATIPFLKSTFPVVFGDNPS